MASTMTYVGLDVHARSTHAAAIDVASGELRRARFGGNSAILGRLEDGSMPCDQAWPDDQVAVFRRWIDAGKPE